MVANTNCRFIISCLSFLGYVRRIKIQKDKTCDIYHNDSIDDLWSDFPMQWNSFVCRNSKYHHYFDGWIYKRNNLGKKKNCRKKEQYLVCASQLEIHNNLGDFFYNKTDTNSNSKNQFKRGNSVLAYDSIFLFLLSLENYKYLYIKSRHETRSSKHKKEKCLIRNFHLPRKNARSVQRNLHKNLLGVFSAKHKIRIRLRRGTGSLSF